MDFGEMFHNFPMAEGLRKCAGVELRSGGEVVMLRWTRLFMGMRPSPYNAVRYYYWGEEFARGDPSLGSNPMGYDSIRMNLPGMDSYDPSFPKIAKWNSVRQSVAGDVITFVDDVRIVGSSKENCHEVHRQVASRFQFLGMQDAPRKSGLLRRRKQVHGQEQSLKFRRTQSQSQWHKINGTRESELWKDLNPFARLTRKLDHQSIGRHWKRRLAS